MLLVTGITGHSGRYFVEQLISNNYKGKIRCLVRKSSNIHFLKNSGLNIEIIVGDLNDKDCLEKITKNVDTILHIYNIRYSIPLAKAAILNKVKRMIAVHTTGIYSKFRIAAHDYIKIESELIDLAAKNQIDLTILRPTMIYGDICDYNMSKFIKMVDKLLIFPLINGGKNLIQPVNARDLAKAYYDVLIHPKVTANNHYNLSGDRPISIKEALTIISNKLNKKTIFIPVPLNISVLAAYFLKIITIGKLDIIEKVLRMGEDRAFNHELAKKDFNYSPMTFEEGIEIEILQYLTLNKR